MIIEWTYGTLAQVQRYFGVGYWLTDSVLGFIIVTPAARTLIISAEIRSKTIESETRSVIVPSEDRTINIT